MTHAFKKLISLLIILSFSCQSIGLDSTLYATRYPLSEDALRPVASVLSGKAVSVKAYQPQSYSGEITVLNLPMWGNSGIHVRPAISLNVFFNWMADKYPLVKFDIRSLSNGEDITPTETLSWYIGEINHNDKVAITISSDVYSSEILRGVFRVIENMLQDEAFLEQGYHMTDYMNKIRVLCGQSESGATKIKSTPTPKTSSAGQGREQLEPAKTNRIIPVSLWEGRWSKGFDSPFGKGLYPQPVTDFVLSNLASCNTSKVIDLGSGGLYLARRIKHLIKPGNLTTLDYAIAPDRMADTEDIHVLNGWMENTGLESNSFTAASIVYALEYTSINDAILEVVRLLAEGGRVILVIHHPESGIISHKRACINFVKDILIPFMKGAPSLIDGTQEGLRRLNYEAVKIYASTKMAGYYCKDIDDICNAAATLNNHSLSSVEVPTGLRIERFRSFVMSYIEANQAQVNLDSELIENIDNRFRGLPEIAESFNRFGLHIKAVAGNDGIIRDGSYIYGWGIVLEKGENPEFQKLKQIESGDTIPNTALAGKFSITQSLEQAMISQPSQPLPALTQPTQAPISRPMPFSQKIFLAINQAA